MSRDKTDNVRGSRGGNTETLLGKEERPLYRRRGKRLFTHEETTDGRRLCCKPSHSSQKGGGILKEKKKRARIPAAKGVRTAQEKRT